MLAAVGDLAVATPQASASRESGPIRLGADGVAPVTRTARSGAASARLQAFGLVHRRRLGIREKVDKRLCRDGLL